MTDWKQKPGEVTVDESGNKWVCAGKNVPIQETPEWIRVLMPPTHLTCESCGRTDETVVRIVCGYDRDINGADPDDESRMETVCGDCEERHCDEI